MTEKCQCLIVIPKIPPGGSVSADEALIVYCPTHTAAFEVLDKARELVESIVSPDRDFTDKPWTLRLARELLAMLSPSDCS